MEEKNKVAVKMYSREVPYVFLVHKFMRMLKILIESLKKYKAMTLLITLTLIKLK